VVERRRSFRRRIRDGELDCPRSKRGSRVSTAILSTAILSTPILSTAILSTKQKKNHQHRASTAIGARERRWRLVAAGRLLEPNSMHYPIPTALTHQPHRQTTNFSELNQPHDRYERAPTRGRPIVQGPGVASWQTRRLNSLSS